MTSARFLRLERTIERAERKRGHSTARASYIAHAAAGKVAREKRARHCSVCGKTGHDARRHQRRNPEFFTEAGEVHPIRASAGYDARPTSKQRSDWAVNRLRRAGLLAPKGARR